MCNLLTWLLVVGKSVYRPQSKAKKFEEVAEQWYKTQIVPNTHALAQGSQHIACDPNSLSEIVVPVFNEKSELIAVFDVDSTLEGSFDEIDRDYLEQIMRHFSKADA